MNSKTIKFAISALAIGATMVACTPASTKYGISSAPKAAGGSEARAAAAYAKAQAEARSGSLDAALRHAESAVEQSPRDVAYRMLLADLYMKDGRFQSAETTFEDVLALDSGNVRAGLSVALARIALGRPGAAIGQLDEMGSAAPADLGLAYALAGETTRAVEILEPAARSPEATARVRQNLALAYALAGDWQKARTTAAQDVSPDQLGARMEHWARLAQPRDASFQVATLLGVTPKADEGQPVRLALAPAEGAAYAAADIAAPALGGPVAAPVTVPEAAPEPAAAESEVQLAAQEPAWVPAPQAEPAEVPAPPVYSLPPAKPASTPALVRDSAPAIQAAVRSVSAAPAVARAPRRAAAGPGRYAVQLGAFSSAAAVERAWSQADRRFGFAGRQPLSTTVTLPKGTFHRLSVAGFGTRGEADGLCRSIRAKGGSCFVRSVAGDAPLRFASRRASTRRG